MQAMQMGQCQSIVEPGVYAIRPRHTIDQLVAPWESPTRENPERQEQAHAPCNGESQQKLLDSEKSSGERGGVSPEDELRQDVPTLAHFYSIQDRQGGSFFLALTRMISKSQGHAEHPYPPAGQAVLRAITPWRHAVMCCGKGCHTFGTVHGHCVDHVCPAVHAHCPSPYGNGQRFA